MPLRQVYLGFARRRSQVNEDAQPRYIPNVFVHE